MARITGGRASGRNIPVPVCSGVRPTSGRVREALFSMLGWNVEGATFLDAFGGAGLVGLEAWSRGAAVTLVERDRRAFKDIVQRGKTLEVEWTIHCQDVLRWAKVQGTFDIVFVDPPYALSIQPILETLESLVGQTLVVENPPDSVLSEEIGGLTLDRVRTYGASALWVYQRGGV